MKFKVCAVILCFVVFIFSSGSFAYADSRARNAHDEGSSKLSFGGSLSSTDQYDSDGSYTGTQNQFAAQLAYGYFFADSVEFGLAASGSNNWTNESSTQYGNFTTNLLLKYYFVSESNFVPYVGLLGGMNWTSSAGKDNTTLSGGGTLGFELLVSDNTSLFMEYNVTGHGDETSSGITNKGLFGVTYHF